MKRLQRWFTGALLAGAWLQACAQATPTGGEMQKLAAAQKWSEIVQRLEPVAARTAAMDYSLGMAYAQLGRLAEAERALEAGQRLAPRDSRFPIELAGIAFRQKNNSLAIHRLRAAIRLAPGDAYANDFLGTVYFLEGNLPAAIKYWNRAGKPMISQVSANPSPRINAALLDHAYAFSPAALLTLRQLRDSETRIGGLGIFPQFQFDLKARNDGQFDLQFRAHEVSGFGDGKLEALARFFQGIGFEEVSPSYENMGREAINFNSMFRWDAQKRRIAADFSGPFERSARDRWRVALDLRDENWAIRNGPAPVQAAFNMRVERADFDLASYARAKFRWTAGAEVSRRDFRSVEAGAVLTPELLAAGYELKQNAAVASTLWESPEHRFTLGARGESSAGRLWSKTSESGTDEAFEKLTGSVGWNWLPQAKGGDYETTQRLSAGRTFGQVPFDELFILGLERDNDLPLHAHIGTQDGRKGSAPLGREYFLENLETDKNLYSNGIFKLQLGPLLDIGKIVDPGTALGSHEWLFDTGAQAKLRVLGVGLAFSYGRDLRTGNNAFYVTFLQSEGPAGTGVP